MAASAAPSDTKCVDRATRPVVNCHCTMCRRTSGHFAAFTARRPEDLVLIESEGLCWYRAAGKARRGFCEICGSSLFWSLIVASGFRSRLARWIYRRPARDGHPRVR